MFLYLHAQSPRIGEEHERDDAGGQQNVGNQDEEVDVAYQAFAAKSCGFCGQVKGDVAHKEEHTEAQSCGSECPVNFDFLVSNRNECPDEAEEGGAVENGIQPWKYVQRLPGGFRQGLYRRDQEQQGNGDRNDHGHCPDKALDVCFVVYHSLFVQGPELFDGFQ